MPGNEGKNTYIILILMKSICSGKINFVGELEKTEITPRPWHSGLLTRILHVKKAMNKQLFPARMQNPFGHKLKADREV
jgi:hypothetical protein